MVYAANGVHAYVGSPLHIKACNKNRDMRVEMGVHTQNPEMKKAVLDNIQDLKVIQNLKDGIHEDQRLY